MEQKNWKELLQKYKNYIIVLVILLVAIVTLARSCGQNKTEIIQKISSRIRQSRLIRLFRQVRRKRRKSRMSWKRILIHQ